MHHFCYRTTSFLRELGKYQGWNESRVFFFNLGHLETLTMGVIRLWRLQEGDEAASPRLPKTGRFCVPQNVLW